MKRKILGFLGGVAAGLLNGLLGAGGGMIAVPLLEALGVEGKQAHATSLAVIVPLSLVSAGVYWARGWVSPGEALVFLPGGLLGALLGAKLLARANTAWVKGGFALLLLWGAARSILSGGGRCPPSSPLWRREPWAPWGWEGAGCCFCGSPFWGWTS